MNESLTDELLELAHGYIEQSLSADQVARLEEILESEPEARRVYLDFLQDHATLHWSRVGADDDDAAVVDFEMPGARRFPPLWQVFAAAAVVSLLALFLSQLQDAKTARAFATMAKTESARWESGSLPTAQGGRLGRGELELVRGLATIRFDSGAEVILEAPARLELVDAMNCTLHRGTAVAEVGEKAKGFTIATPRARVIDHGTRFALNVDPATGATQTQVFDGLVEVELPGKGERIALKEGQQTLVAGEGAEAVSEGPVEGTWSRPTPAQPPQNRGVRRIGTNAPGGADAYVWGGKPTTHNSDSLLLLKNGLGENAPHRKVYLRFPLGDLSTGAIEDARLDLRFAPTGWGLASHLEDAEFIVYGLTNDASDAWDPASLDWASAPANDPGNGDGVMPGAVIELGRFLLPRGIQTGSFGIRGAALTRFLNEDQNRIATLIVVRSTLETRGGGLVHAFASSRHPDLPAPTLHLKLNEREAGPRDIPR